MGSSLLDNSYLEQSETDGKNETPEGESDNCDHQSPADILPTHLLESSLFDPGRKMSLVDYISGRRLSKRYKMKL